MGVVTAINFVISSPCKLQLVRSKLELRRDDLFTRTWDITKILLLSGEAGAALPKLKIQVVPSQHICMHFFFSRFFFHVVALIVGRQVFACPSLRSLAVAINNAPKLKN